MNSSDSHARLDRIKSQSSTDASQGESNIPMDLINNGVETPPLAADTEDVPEFFTNLSFGDFFDLPSEYVQMKPEIFSGMSNGSKRCLDKLKSQGTPMACLKSDQGDSVLHLAATWGHVELVKSILSECPRLVLEPNSKDQLPLHVAAYGGHTAVIEALVATITFVSAEIAEEEKERLNIYTVKDTNGDNALHLALKGREMESALCLVKANNQASLLANNEGISPLYLAVQSGDTSLVKAILRSTRERGPEGTNSNLDLDSKLEGRKYLAHAALKSRKTEMLNLILRQYPSLEDERDEKGMSCLAFAVSIGFYDGVCNLLYRDTHDVYVCDNDGSYPIHLAVEKDGEIFDELIKCCPHSKHLLNQSGQNILHIAAKIGKHRLVKSLMSNKDTRHLGVGQDVEGNTPLHLATMNWCSQSITYLASDAKTLLLRNNSGLRAQDIAEDKLSDNYIFQERMTLAFLLYSAHKLLKGSTGHERVRSITKPTKPLDSDRNRAYVNTLLLVAALIATMTFAAGFTIPGGFNSSRPHLGRATLATNPTLVIFLLLDTLAMQCSVATIATLIWAQLGDQALLRSSLDVALPLMLFALLCMPLAFLFGVATAVGHVKWLLAILCIISFIFFYWALFILGPHVLLQQSNVSPKDFGCFLVTFMHSKGRIRNLYY